MKSNLCTLALFLEFSAKKYFIFLVDALVDEVSTTVSLFCKSPITAIIDFKF